MELIKPFLCNKLIFFFLKSSQYFLNISRIETYPFKALTYLQLLMYLIALYKTPSNFKHFAKLRLFIIGIFVKVRIVKYFHSSNRMPQKRNVELFQKFLYFCVKISNNVMPHKVLNMVIIYNL